MMRHSLLILLLCCGSVLARDPFRPAAEAACIPAVEPLTGWHLQGIIGRETHFSAWLLTPQGESVKVHTSQPFPLLPWQLTDITRRSITFAVENSCNAQQTSFYLKGRSYDKDRYPATGRVLPDASSRR